MKNSLYIAITAILLITSLSATAAGKEDNNRRQWTKEMLDYKHDFIAEQTEMTPAQRDKFMPIYEAMEKEVFAVNREAREQAKKVSAAKGKVSDQEYGNAAKAMSA